MDTLPKQMVPKRGLDKNAYCHWYFTSIQDPLYRKSEASSKTSTVKLPCKSVMSKEYADVTVLIDNERVKRKDWLEEKNLYRKQIPKKVYYVPKYCRWIWTTEIYQCMARIRFRYWKTAILFSRNNTRKNFVLDFFVEKINP